MNQYYCNPTGYYWDVKEKPTQYISLMDKICTIAGRYFGGITIEQMKSKTKKREIFTCRAICMELQYKEHKTLEEIGKYFGGRHHSTVINAREALQDLLDTKVISYDLLNKIMNDVNK